MDFGILTINKDLLVFIGIGSGLWLFLTLFLIPRSRLKLSEAHGSEISQRAVKLSIWRSFQFISFAMFFAPLSILVVYAVAQSNIEGSLGDSTKIQTLINTRDFLERTLQPIQAIALETWVFAIVILGAIWIWARMSGSRRSWDRALEARRKAHTATLEMLDTTELLRLAEQTNSDGFSRLQTKAVEIERENRKSIREIEQAKVLGLPQSNGEQVPASIDDIRELIVQVNTEVEALETNQVV